MLARIVLWLLADLAALFFRRQLALDQERGVKPRRVTAAVGAASAIDPEGMGGPLQPRTPANGARSRRAGPAKGGRAACDTTNPPFRIGEPLGVRARSVLGGLHHEYLPVPAWA